MIDKELKWASECKDAGFEYLRRGSRNGYSMVKCNVCGGVGEYQQSDIRRGRVRCKACHETKMINECRDQGFVWLKKVDANRSLCRCLVCGHEDTFQQGSMRKGEVKCSHCHETKMINECLDQGFEWLKKVDATYSLCRCLTCWHIDEYRQDAIRAGAVACSNCSPGHWNEPSNFYVVRISFGYDSLIKIGISNNPSLRYKQYGLPSDAFIEQLLTIPFDTKLDAIKYESKMKQLLEPYRIDPDVAKAVLSYSGFTECYNERSLDILI